MAKKATKFIAKAIKRPGALRAKARARGLLKGEQTLSESDLAELAEDDTRTKRQVNLARTLRKLGRR